MPLRVRKMDTGEAAQSFPGEWSGDRVCSNCGDKLNPAGRVIRCLLCHLYFKRNGYERPTSRRAWFELREQRGKRRGRPPKLADM